MKRAEKIKSLRTEYLSLLQEKRGLQERIKAQWATLSVQDMRQIEGRFLVCDQRLAAIKTTEAYKSFDMADVQ